jgi:microcystin-dependent protein
MADQFIGEIRAFGFWFAPTGWAQCNGQLMPISQNTALFSLLGTQYGGDGRSTFGLPNLQESAPLNQGDGGGGLSSRYCGETGGVQYVTLTQAEMPQHNHNMSGTSTIGEVSSPTMTTPLSRSTGKAVYHAPDAALVSLDPRIIGVAYGSTPHNNLMPYLVLNFCIALQGIYPPRS